MEKMQLSRQQIIALAKNQDNPKLRHEKAFLMHLFGSPAIVDVFEILIGWLPYGKRADGSIYKSDVELAEETGLSTKTIERARKILKESAFEVYLKKANGAPTSHYRFDLEKFIHFVAKKLNTEIEKIRAWLGNITHSKAAKSAAEIQQVSKDESGKLSKSTSLANPIECDSEKISKTLSTLSRNEIREKGEVPDDIESKSSTTSTSEITTAIEEKTDSSEGDCWVYDRKAMLYGRISSPDIQNEVRAEVHRLHLLLKLPETQIEDWINEYGFYRVNNLTRYALEDHRVKYPESWVALGLKNKFKLDSKWQPVTSRIDNQTGPYSGLVQS